MVTMATITSVIIISLLQSKVPVPRYVEKVRKKFSFSNHYTFSSNDYIKLIIIHDIVEKIITNSLKIIYNFCVITRETTFTDFVIILLQVLLERIGPILIPCSVPRRSKLDGRLHRTEPQDNSQKWQSLGLVIDRILFLIFLVVVIYCFTCVFPSSTEPFSIF